MNLTPNSGPLLVLSLLGCKSSTLRSPWGQPSGAEETEEGSSAPRLWGLRHNISFITVHFNVIHSFNHFMSQFMYLCLF